MRALAIISLIPLLFTGCVSYTSGGARHHVVLGFGVVTVRTNDPTALVVKSTTVGLGASSFPVGRCTVGFSRTVTTIVETNQNVVIEVK